MIHRDGRIGLGARRVHARAPRRRAGDLGAGVHARHHATARSRGAAADAGLDRRADRPAEPGAPDGRARPHARRERAPPRSSSSTSTTSRRSTTASATRPATSSSRARRSASARRCVPAISSRVSAATSSRSSRAGTRTSRSIARRALEAVSRSHGLLGHDVHPTASAGIATGTDADDDPAQRRPRDVCGEGGGRRHRQRLRSGHARRGEGAARRSPASSAAPSCSTSSSFTTSRPSTCARDASSRSRPWSAGSTRRVACCSRASSSATPRAPARSTEIGRWALETATAQLAEWQDRLERPPRVAVNISTIQLRSPDLLAEITALLLKSKLPPQALRLELTESAVLRSDDNSKAVLRSLARARRPARARRLRQGVLVGRLSREPAVQHPQDRQVVPRQSAADRVAAPAGHHRASRRRWS